MKRFHRYFVYILKCADLSYYVGVTSDLDRRLLQHKGGFFKGSYTHSRRPVELVFYGTFTDIGVAIEWEKRIKGWSRKKKEALIEDDFNALVIASKKRFDK